MLLDLREKVRNSKPIKYTLITLICIPFALVGIGSYLTGGAAPPVATVNGVEVSQIALEQAYRFQRSQLAQMFGGQLPEGLGSESVLREQARDQLINEQVIMGAVEEAGFAVGDDTLGRAIQSNPAFQVDGQFDQETYLRAVSVRSGSAANFEETLRAQTAIGQFSEGLMESGFTLPGEAERAAALQRQTRNVDIVTLSLNSLQESIEISDEDTQAYFDENADSYEFPDRAKVQYIELNSTDQADAIDILDEDAQAYYDNNRRVYLTPEQRSASHILLEADGSSEVAEKTEIAAQIKARLDAGESFEDLAKEFSDDPGSADLGGSLGGIVPGQMVPEFEDALNELAEIDNISEPVITQYGVHLIKLDAIQPETGKPFEEVKDEIVANLKTSQADSEFNSLLDSLEESAFDFSDELDTAAAETGLEVQTTDWIDVESDSNGDLFSNPALLQAVFSDEVLLDGLNSEAIQIAPRHVVVLRVLDSEGPRPKTIDDVREEIVTTLQNEQAAEQLDQLADEIEAKLVAGEDVTEVADAEELAEAVVGESLQRSGSELDITVVNAIFAAVKPSDSAPTISALNAGNGDRVVFALRSVGVAEAEEGEAEPQVANPRAGNTAFTAMVESLRSRAKIELNDDALVPGGYGGYGGAGY